MSSRLLIGILCIMLGLVLMVGGRSMGHQKIVLEERWLTATVDPIVKYTTLKATNSKTGRVSYSYVGDFTFVTEGGKTINITRNFSQYTLAAFEQHRPVMVKYLPSNPTRIFGPYSTFDDTSDSSSENMSESERMDAAKAERKSSAAFITVAGVCLAFLGGLMVYAAFKN